MLRGGKQISRSLICRLSRGRKFSPSEQRHAGIIVAVAVAVVVERFHRRKAACAIYANYSSESPPPPVLVPLHQEAAGMYD